MTSASPALWIEVPSGMSRGGRQRLDRRHRRAETGAVGEVGLDRRAVLPVVALDRARTGGELRYRRRRRAAPARRCCSARAGLPPGTDPAARPPRGARVIGICRSPALNLARLRVGVADRGDADRRGERRGGHAHFGGEFGLRGDADLGSDQRGGGRGVLDERERVHRVGEVGGGGAGGGLGVAQHVDRDVAGVVLVQHVQADVRNRRAAAPSVRPRARRTSARDRPSGHSSRRCWPW